MLPVLFVCEDNRWSATTASAPMIGGEGASARAQGLGIEAVGADAYNYGAKTIGSVLINRMKVAGS